MRDGPESLQSLNLQEHCKRISNQEGWGPACAAECQTYLNAFAEVAASFSSLSFFSRCPGGVAVRLEMPDSPPPGTRPPPGPRVRRVLDPLAENIDVGPNDGAPCELGCRDPPLLPSRLRSSIPTVFLW